MGSLHSNKHLVLNTDLTCLTVACSLVADWVCLFGFKKQKAIDRATFYKEIPMPGQELEWSLHCRLLKPPTDVKCPFVYKVVRVGLFFFAVKQLQNDVTKFCYFADSQLECFQFVQISKLLAKVTPNPKYRAVFLVMPPESRRPKSALLDSGWLDTTRVAAISEVHVFGAGVSSAATCIRLLLYSSAEKWRPPHR